RRRDGGHREGDGLRHGHPRLQRHRRYPRALLSEGRPGERHLRSIRAGLAGVHDRDRGGGHRPARGLKAAHRAGSRKTSRRLPAAPNRFFRKPLTVAHPASKIAPQIPDGELIAMKYRLLLGIAAAAVVAFAGTANAQFYKGKRITMLINYGA